MKTLCWAALALAACAEPRGELVEVTRGDLVVAVDVAGVLAAADSTNINTPLIVNFGDSFPLAQVAAEGSEVKAGDLIATLDPSELDRNLEALQTEIKQAQTLLEQRTEQNAATRRLEALGLLQAEATAWKAASLTEAPPDLVASVEMRGRRLDDEKARLALQQMRLDLAATQEADAAAIARLVDDRASAQARFDELTRSRKLLTITSPRAGTVIYLTGRDKLKVGESVSDVFMYVVGLDAMIGDGAVDEVDVAWLAVHQPVTLRVDALADVQLHGTVANVAANVQVRSQGEPTRIVKLEIAIDGARAVPLRPGMRFRGQVEIRRLPGVLQIPAEAVFVTPDGPVAYRQAGDDLEPVHLTLGSRTTDRIEVTAGLTAGDRVSREGAP